MLRRFLYVISLVLAFASVADAATVFTPPLLAGRYWTPPEPPHPWIADRSPRLVTDGHFSCSGTNVSSRARDITLALVGPDGTAFFEQTCEDVPAAGTCWYETEGSMIGAEPHYCRIEIAGSKAHVRGTIEVYRSGGHVTGRTVLQAD